MNREKLLRAYDIVVARTVYSVDQDYAELREILRELVLGEMSGSITYTPKYPSIQTSKRIDEPKYPFATWNDTTSAPWQAVGGSVCLSGTDTAGGDVK